MVAERVTKVVLKADIQSYLAGMEQARQKTSQTASEMDKLTQQRQAMELLGRASLVAGGLIAAGLALAVARAADFDQAMSNVQAATRESAENMAELRQAALDAGAETVFSATESANAIEELGKAGLSTKDILAGGLTGALDLAAAGGLGVADAAGIAATTLQQFQLEGKDASHVADLLAAGAGKAMGDVGDMSQALKQAGLVANQFGISVEETVGTLSAFASAGMLGSDAGTSFRTMLLRLANPTDEVKTLMKDLDIQTYDAQGKFIGLAGLAGQLQTALGGMTDQQKQTTLAMIFGQDAIRGATILLNEGEKGIRDWTDAVNEQGYAADTAAARLDNLNGDIEQLGGAFDTALIQSGSAANDVLRWLVQSATDGVNAFGALPVPVQGAAFAVAGLGAAVLLVNGALLVGTPKLVEYRAAIAEMSPATQKAAAGLGAAARAAGVFAAAVAVGQAASGVSGWIKDVTGATKTAEDFTLALKEGASAADLVDSSLQKTGEATDLFGGSGSQSIKNLTGSFSGLASVAADIQDIDWLTGLVDFTSFSLYDTSLKTTRDNLKELDSALADLTSSGNGDRAAQVWAELVKQTDGSDESIQKLKDLLPKYTSAQMDAEGATSDAAGSTKDQAEALSVLQGRVADAGEEIDDLADKIRGFGSAQFDLADAQESVEAAVDDFTASLEKNGATLDIGTDAGRANAKAARDIAETYLDLAASTVAATRNQADAVPIIQAGRDAFIEARVAAGDSREAAEAYADQLGLIPGNIDTAVKLSGLSDAQVQLQAFRAEWQGKTITMDLFLDTSGGNRAAAAAAARYTAYAAAGGRADGGVETYSRAFASGGVAEGMYSGGTPIYKFAEPETVWEAFISGRKGRERQNFQYAIEAAARLAPSIGFSGGSGGRSVDQSTTVNLNGPVGMQPSDVSRAIETGRRRALAEAGISAGGSVR